MVSRIVSRLKPYYFRKAFRYLRHYGPKDFMIRVRERLAPENVPYDPWFRRHRATEEELEAQRKECADAELLFSVVVPAWRTDERFLREMTESVLNQTYPGFELVIANASPEDKKMSGILKEYMHSDSRLRVVDVPENKGISSNTNAAIAASSAEWICFMDHDDIIAPDAMYEMAKLAKSGRYDLIYTDEDKIRDDGKGGFEHFQPHFKPGFDLDLLRSNNYICHFLAVRRSLIEKAGMPDDAYNGAQDYEFILRCVDTLWADGHKDDREGHIPKVLYHWRTHEKSTADNPDSKTYAYEAGKKALEEHLKRRGEKGEVSQTPDHGFYRIRYELTGHPKVTIIIPNREQRQTLERCIDSVRRHTDYDNYEVIVVENNSSSKEILDYYKKIQGKDHIRVIRRKGEFNFSAINNYAAGLHSHDSRSLTVSRGETASGPGSDEYLVFMNNDIEVRDGWLTELLAVCARPGVGAAGPKLYYPDGKVQSAGIIVGIGGVAGSLFTGMNGNFSGYLHKASLMQDLSAVTAALMIVSRDAFERVGGFTEELAVAFNDVDLCLKLRREGYLIVYDPFAQAVHHESESRGDEYTADKAQRWRGEASYMKEHWQEYYTDGDPYYNPNLSLARWDYSLRP